MAKTVGLSRQVRLLDMSRYRMLWIPKEWAEKLGLPKGGKVIAELVVGEETAEVTLRADDARWAVRLRPLLL